jgi:hypothetical protein
MSRFGGPTRHAIDHPDLFSVQVAELECLPDCGQPGGQAAGPSQ